MTSVVTREGDKASWVQIAGDTYLCCGTDCKGKRFRISSTRWMQIEGINCWQGRKYLVRKGKRYLIKTITN